MKNKRAQILQQTLIHIIIIGLVASIFMFSIFQRIDSRGVRQQLIEKQVALLIDSSISGVVIYIDKINPAGYISSVKINGNKIFIVVDDLVSINGYSFFSLYEVSIKEEDDFFKITIK